MYVEKVELLAIKEDTYTVYVFRNLDTNKYIMCTRLPNWRVPSISIGDKGYLEYQTVLAGESYYDPTLGIYGIYQYSNVYFINFILEANIIQNNEIIL